MAARGTDARRRTGGLLRLIAVAAALAAPGAFAGDADVRKIAKGALGVMGLSVVPSETASTLAVSTGTAENFGLKLAQFGGAFTVSDEVPLYLEGFIGASRYDPRFVFSRGEDRRETIPAKWTTVAGTAGVGWDVALTDELTLRPIGNVSLGHVESDASLAGRLLERRTDAELEFLERGRLDAVGVGGSLMLDFERYSPEREIDVELRFTQIRLETLPTSSAQAEGSADATTLGLWSRLRVPTGAQVFDRPLRAVGEFSFGRYIGDQERFLGTPWLAQLGAGLEVDVGAISFGYTQRIRLTGRFVFGENNVRGFSTGVGISF